jgi:hypothetical protein
VPDYDWSSRQLLDCETIIDMLCMVVYIVHLSNVGTFMLIYIVVRVCLLAVYIQLNTVRPYCQANVDNLSTHAGAGGLPGYYYILLLSSHDGAAIRSVSNGPGLPGHGPVRSAIWLRPGPHQKLMGFSGSTSKCFRSN